MSGSAKDSRNTFLSKEFDFQFGTEIPREISANFDRRDLVVFYVAFTNLLPRTNSTTKISKR